MPAVRQTSLEAAGLAFALADYRWRTLRHDPYNWREPQRQRALAAAFLDYHAAKLALLEACGDLGPEAQVGA